MAGLRAAFDEGRITAGVAKQATRLPEGQLARLEQLLNAGGRLTFAEIRDAARKQTSAATAQRRYLSASMALILAARQFEQSTPTQQQSDTEAVALNAA